MGGTVPSALANTVNIGADGSGATDSIFGLSPTLTGAGMANLLTVTVYFAGGGSSSALWASGCGALCGSATGSIGNGSWTLTQAGDTGAVTNTNSPDTTANNPWTLTSSSSTVAIASVSLSGIVNPSSGLVFDRDLSSGGQAGTPGSNFGIDYTFKSESGGHNPYTVNVVYDNQAAIAGAVCSGIGTTSPCGDVWGRIDFAFSGTNTFIATTTSAPTTWMFFQDTDLVIAPEPTTIAITGLGLGTLILACRRRALSRTRL